jgi:hypothetical protein
MKRALLSVLAVLMLASVATPSEAQYHRRGHRVCYYRHHHRICRWR